MNQNNFKFTMPASLEKAKDGEWRVKGLASTEKVDQQGEIVIQKGMDLSPVDKKKGWLNFDHRTGPQNLIGTLDGYKKTPEGLYIEGRLFKNHEMAKHVYGIMSSLSESDRGKAGLSIEGKILERDAKNPKIIKKCQIHNVAITFNPVNDETFVDLAKSRELTQDLMKSMSDAEVDFDTSKTFTSDEVVEILQKALGVGAGAAAAPVARTGGDALQVSNMSEEEKKKKKKKDASTEEESAVKSLKKLSFELYKANMITILDKLQVLYPDCNRSELWESLRDRLERKFPDLSESEKQKSE